MLDYAGGGRRPSVCMAKPRIGALDPQPTLVLSKSGGPELAVEQP